jgi:hypothetical protein
MVRSCLLTAAFKVYVFGIFIQSSILHVDDRKKKSKVRIRLLDWEFLRINPNNCLLEPEYDMRRTRIAIK